MSNIPECLRSGNCPTFKAIIDERAEAVFTADPARRSFGREVRRTIRGAVLDECSGFADELQPGDTTCPLVVLVEGAQNA
jgi:hypothetical protein